MTCCCCRTSLPVPTPKLSSAQQLELGDLLNATAAVGQPLRVAIIARSQDLGTVGVLWGRPQTYAEYLGYELSDTYTGRLLVVMPGGFGVYWAGAKGGPKSMTAALSSLRVGGDSASALVRATEAAVHRIEGAAGVTATALARHSSSSTGAGSNGASVSAATPAAPSTSRAPSATSGQHGLLDALLVLVALALLGFYVAYRRGWLPKSRSGETAAGAGAGSRVGERTAGLLKRVRLKPVLLLPMALVLIVVAALVVNHTGSSPTSAAGGTLATNADLDQGTQLGEKPAPPITLTDETGKSISLRQYRGKVVILGFIDAECQTICPLTTAAMVDAKRALGPAGKDVQLLGVDANWKSTQIDDVLNYTDLHGLTGQWHFLTGSVPQLERIWTAYGVNEKLLMEEDSNAIDHVAAVFMIDPQGRLRTVYTTQSSILRDPTTRTAAGAGRFKAAAVASQGTDALLVRTGEQGDTRSDGEPAALRRRDRNARPG